MTVEVCILYPCGLSKIVIKPPGPKSKEWIERNKACMAVKTASRFLYRGVVASKAEGVYVTDLDGNVYIDFSMLRTNTGHTNPRLIAAIKQQIDMGGFEATITPKATFEEKLKEIAPGKLADGIVGICRGGTHAAIHTVQMVVSYTRRNIILAAPGSFVPLPGSFVPLPGTYVVYVPLPHCYRCPLRQEYPKCELLCLDYIEYVLDKVAPPREIAAFFVEPIYQYSGVVVPPNEYFRRIREICDKHKILLVDDEVATGFGRTGKMFGIEHWGITPDVMFLGKPIANGLTLGAVIGRPDVMGFYGGGKRDPVSCRVATANIDFIVNKKLVENASKVGRYLMKRLKEMQDEHKIIGDVRGKGLLIGVELVKNSQKKLAIEEAEKVHVKARENGLLLELCCTSKQTLRLSPPLIVTTEQIDEALRILDKTFRELNM